MNEYKWKLGFVNRQVSAQDAGEHIAQLHAVNDNLYPEDVVESAREDDSPIHELFEWDDDAAAQEYRKDQARLVMRSLTVTVIIEGEEREPRAFVSVQQEGRYTYTPLKAAMEDEGLREQVIKIALHELQSFRRKYREYRELRKLVSDVGLLVEQHTP